MTEPRRGKNADKVLNPFMHYLSMSSDIKVGDIMSKNVISIEGKKSVVEAAKLMKEYDVGSVIVAENKKAEGIITQRDIIHKVTAEGNDQNVVIAHSVMSTPLRVIKPETTLEEAAKTMKKYRIKRLPVINEDNELVGIISEGDISRIFPAVVDLIEEKARIEK